MTSLPVHTPSSAPAESRPLLEAAEKSFGFVPHLLGMLAGSPAALGTYLAASEAFGKSALAPVEQHVVLLTVSFENRCDYCVSAHSAIALGQRVPQEVVAALREDEELPDERLEALRHFTRRVVEVRGWVAEEELQGFLAAGFEPRHVLDVLTGVAMKTLSNYANHVAHTPLDQAFEPHAWQPATERS